MASARSATAVLVLCSWSSLIHAEDCGVALVDALKAKYSLSDSASDAGHVRNVLCKELRSSSAGAAGGGFAIPINGVPFSFQLNDEHARRKRESMCSDASLWTSAQRVREVTESLLDDNGLVAYRECLAKPQLRCASTRSSPIDVEFTLLWVPFSSITSATQTAPAFARNLQCQSPSMKPGHVFQSNVPSVAYCTQTDPRNSASLTIPTDRGDYKCDVKASAGPSLLSLVEECAQASTGACERLNVEVVALVGRCRALHRPSENATPTQAQDSAIAERQCVNIAGNAAAVVALSRSVGDGPICDESCKAMKNSIRESAFRIRADLAKYGLDRATP